MKLALREVSIENTYEGSKAESVNSKMLGSRSFCGSCMIPVTMLCIVIFAERQAEFCKKVLFFAHRGHLQALKVCDLKLLCLSQLCGLKDRIIKVGIYIEKYIVMKVWVLKL
jgi:hypothetical protein